MPSPACRKQVSVPFLANFQAHLEYYRSVFITSLLVLWAFQLTLDPTKPFNDLVIMTANIRSCPIKFKLRIPEAELRRMMEDCSEDL